MEQLDEKLFLNGQKFWCVAHRDGFPIIKNGFYIKACNCKNFNSECDSCGWNPGTKRKVRRFRRHCQSSKADMPYIDVHSTFYEDSAGTHVRLTGTEYVCPICGATTGICHSHAEAAIKWRIMTGEFKNAADIC